MLQQLEDRSGLDPASSPEVVNRDWLRGWALADLKKAEVLFEAKLPASKESRT